MSVDYSGPQLISVKGWVERRLVLYVNGNQPEGPLAPYLFKLNFEDEAGQTTYTLPTENDGTPIMPRLIKPDVNGVIRIGPTPVHPRRGGLVLKAWAADTRSGLPDLQARCSYAPSVSGPLLFRVDYAVDMGQVASQDAQSRALGSDVVTETSGREYSVEVGGEYTIAEIVKIGGKGGYKNTGSRAVTSGQDTVTTGTTNTTTRPVAFIRSISIKAVAVPPDL